MPSRILWFLLERRYVLSLVRVFWVSPVIYVVRVPFRLHRFFQVLLTVVDLVQEIFLVVLLGRKIVKALIFGVLFFGRFFRGFVLSLDSPRVVLEIVEILLVLRCTLSLALVDTPAVLLGLHSALPLI